MGVICGRECGIVQSGNLAVRNSLWRPMGRSWLLTIVVDVLKCGEVVWLLGLKGMDTNEFNWGESMRLLRWGMLFCVGNGVWEGVMERWGVLV